MKILTPIAQMSYQKPYGHGRQGNIIQLKHILKYIKNNVNKIHVKSTNNISR